MPKMIDNAMGMLPKRMADEVKYELARGKRGPFSDAVIPLNDELLERARRIRTLESQVSRLVAENEALRAANTDLALSCRSWKAENEAKDALLRQAVEALEKSRLSTHYECRCEGKEHWPHCYWKRHQNLIAAIREHLKDTP